MAKQIKHKKGFLVFDMSAEEVGLLGGLGVCDFCGQNHSDGFYIAVLNSWYCPKCYKQWSERAKYYPEDRMVEQRNFVYVKGVMNLAK